MLLLNKDDRIKLRSTVEFKRTNYIWNKLRLNQAFMIGYLMAIIKEINPSNFDEWEQGYLKSGQKRLVHLSKISEEDREQLSDYQGYSESNVYIKDKEILKLNTYMGRTINDLLEIAKILKKATNLPLDTCFNFIYIRVIDETWIGKEREIKSLATLKNLYKEFEIKEVSQSIDVKYAVDFEVFKDRKLILAIQLKSLKYYESTGLDAKGIMKSVKDFNKIKNEEYTKVYNVPVVYIYTSDGINLLNLEKLNLLCY